MSSTEDDVEQAKPLTEETWRKWLKDFSEKRLFPGQVISREEIKPFPIPELPPYLMGIDHAKDIERQLMFGDAPKPPSAIRIFFSKLKRRLRMRAKKERMIRTIVREEIRKELDAHTCGGMHKQPMYCQDELYYHIESPLSRVIGMILDHLGVTLRQTPGMTELVSTKKPRKRPKKKKAKRK